MSSPWSPRIEVRKAAPDFAHIDLGNGSLGRICAISELTKQGAILTLTETYDLPEEFTLRIMKRSGLRRHCRVVHREGIHVRVEFLPTTQAREAAEVITLDC